MSKFTPGPWEVNTYTNYAGWSVFGPLEGSAIGGCVAERWYSSNLTKEPTTEAHANAHLIAAAPELYAALSAIVPEGDDWWCPTCKEALDGSRVTNSECCDTCGTYLAGINAPEWLKAARAALAKADGQESA